MLKKSEDALAKEEPPNDKKKRLPGGKNFFLPLAIALIICFLKLIVYFKPYFLGKSSSYKALSQF
ncbi:MAG: hypothetical protein MK289_02215 [Trichodesmium sp. ALOHA_ZT_67]|nr:hypothetical protein [Trichodesmium sp. ALOHA_ZT_67]